MGQYHRLINITMKEYVDPWAIGGMGKHYEQLWNHRSLQDALYCLVIAQGNDKRGGGDLHGSDMLGRWAGHRCAIVGDYYTDSRISTYDYERKSTRSAYEHRDHCLGTSQREL